MRWNINKYCSSSSDLCALLNNFDVDVKWYWVWTQMDWAKKKFDYVMYLYSSGYHIITHRMLQILLDSFRLARYFVNLNYFEIDSNEHSKQWEIASQSQNWKISFGRGQLVLMMAFQITIIANCILDQWSLINHNLSYEIIQCCWQHWLTFDRKWLKSSSMPARSSAINVIHWLRMQFDSWK